MFPLRLFCLLLLLPAQLHAHRYALHLGTTCSVFRNLDRLKATSSNASGNASEVGIRDVVLTSPYYALQRHLQITPRWGWGIEMSHVRAGCRYQSFALHLSYISLATWVSYHLSQKNPYNHFYGGISSNFLWRATPINIPLLEERHIAPLDTGVIIGMQYTIFQGLGFEMRYHWGICDVLYFDHPEERPRELGDVALENHYLQVSLTYQLQYLKPHIRVLKGYLRHAKNTYLRHPDHYYHPKIHHPIDFS